jgi:hypothetical protein
MSSIVLKVKDSFNKATKKGIECDIAYLSNKDYDEFCSDLKMEGISEIDINGLKLSIVRVDGKEKSYLNIKSFKNKRKKF